MPFSATADVLDTYDYRNDRRSDSDSPPLSPARRGRQLYVNIDTGLSAPRLPPPSRPESRLSTFSVDSTAHLIPQGVSQQDEREMLRDRDPEKPFRYKLPLHSDSETALNAHEEGEGAGESGWCQHFRGWNVIAMSSWLNVLLVLIPVSWALDLSMAKSKTLVFIFCILSMIPLAKLHDLGTRDLSLRIGGSKTGLLNASMSNTVEIVVAITALRKCEIRVVQSSLIGGILSKLLLVLGMCFFAGGLRFQEQDFDPTATGIHSSLLSISVGAVLLPAAYHFALSRHEDDVLSALAQKQDILKMSRGVSVVLLFIYAAYLVFQLWSHTHLYKEHDKHSKRHDVSVKMPASVDSVRFKMPRTSSRPGSATPSRMTMGRLPTPAELDERLGYLARAGTNSSQTTLAMASDGRQSGPSYTPSGSQAKMSSSQNPTIRLVNGEASVNSGLGSAMPMSRTSTLQDTVVGSTADLGQPAEIEEQAPEVKKKRPELSWFMTLLLLTSVTVMVAVNAEWLVSSIDGISPTISKEWIGLILLPIVGSIAELATTVNVSVKDRLTLSVSVAVGSTIQTALFVIPSLVILGWIIDKPLGLLFDPFESVVLYISVHTMGYVVADGKSNWLEGIILMCLYVIIAVSFWFYPGSDQDLASSLAVCNT